MTNRNKNNNEQRNSRPRFRFRPGAFTYGLIIGFLLLIIAFLGWRNLIQTSSTTSISSTQLRSTLESASDLITTRYYYSDVGKYENSLELNGWTIPFTQKTFLLTYQGEIQIGVDMEDLEVTMTDDVITVTCSSLELLSNEIDDTSIEVYDESKNLFNPMSVSDVVAFNRQAKKDAATNAAKPENIEIYKKDAATAITSILNVLDGVRENYTIEVVFETDELRGVDAYTTAEDDAQNAAESSGSEKTNESDTKTQDNS